MQSEASPGNPPGIGKRQQAAQSVADVKRVAISGGESWKKIIEKHGKSIEVQKMLEDSTFTKLTLFAPKKPT